MKMSELFRVALKEALKIHGCTQKKMSHDLGIGPILVNDFLKARRNFSEDRMAVIAQYFNMSLFEMLNFGHQLVTGTEPTAPDLPVNLKDVISKLKGLDQESLKLISALADKLPKATEP